MPMRVYKEGGDRVKRQASCEEWVEITELALGIQIRLRALLEKSSPVLPATTCNHVYRCLAEMGKFEGKAENTRDKQLGI